MPRTVLNEFENRSTSRFKRREQIRNSCQENVMQLKHLSCAANSKQREKAYLKILHNEENNK